MRLAPIALLVFAVGLSCGRAPIDGPPKGATGPAASVETKSAAQQGDTYPCETDADCFHTGCSGQICASQDVITTCEFKCDYGCLAQAPCQCVGNRCAFRHGHDLAACMNGCRDTSRTGIPCGPNTCDSETQVCCNESCGICTPPGGFCIQIVCPP